MQREKEGRGREYVGLGSAALNGMLREGLAVKVTFDQRGEGSEGKSRVRIFMENVPGREVTSLKSTRREQAWKGGGRKSKRRWDPAQGRPVEQGYSGNRGATRGF